MMARVVELEEEVKVQLSNSVRASVGVLVGQLSDDKDCLLFHVPTPTLEGAAEDSDRGAEDMIPDEWWIDDHAHQVWDLLPGGLAVVGMCVVSTSTSTLPLARLSSLVARVCGEDVLLQPYFPQPHTRRVLLHYSTTSKQFQCQVVDTAHSHAGFQPAVLCIRRLAHSWLQLNCTVPIDTQLHMPRLTGDLSRTVQEYLLQALAPWQKGVVVDGGMSWSTDKPVGEGGGSKPVLFPVQRPLVCGSSELVEHAVALQVRGELVALASLPPGSAAREAAHTLGSDAVRSMSVRWSRLCEDSPEFKQRLADPRTHVWQLPKRVLVEVEGLTLRLCAYRFPDESRKELRDRVAEILSVPPQQLTLRDLEKMVSMGTKDRRKALGCSSTQLSLMACSVLVSIAAAIVWNSSR